MKFKIALLGAVSALSLAATAAVAQVDPGSPAASSVGRGLITAPSAPPAPGSVSEVVVTAPAPGSGPGVNRAEPRRLDLHHQRRLH